MLETDVIVVGAGPAGSMSAIQLRNYGLTVLVLEEHSAIGKPLHCSGLVTPRTLESAGMDHSLVLNEIKGAEIFVGDVKPLVLGNEVTRALVIDRVAFDKYLANQAVLKGAQLNLGHRVTHIENTPSGTTIAHANQKTFSSRILFGCDGWRSKVSTHLGNTKKDLIWCFGGEGIVSNHPKDMVRVYLDAEIAPNWFGWTIPLDNKRVRIGIGTTFGSPERKPIHLFNKLLKQYPTHFEGLTITSLSGGFIPLYTPQVIESRNSLLIGDAASHAKPTSGGGIYTALEGAKTAAQTAYQALSSIQAGPVQLNSYHSAWSKTLGKELVRGSELRKVFMDLQSNNQLPTLINTLSIKPLKKMVHNYGDIDYPSALVNPILRVASAMIGPALQLSKMSRASLPLKRFVSQLASQK